MFGIPLFRPADPVGNAERRSFNVNGRIIEFNLIIFRIIKFKFNHSFFRECISPAFNFKVCINVVFIKVCSYGNNFRIDGRQSKKVGISQDSFNRVGCIRACVGYLVCPVRNLSH